MTLPTTPNLDLSGKRALVTGAGRGIGRAAAVALAQAGADTSLVARTHEDVKRVADELVAAGYQASAHKLDVTDTESLCKWFATQKPFQILVNNAGTARHNTTVATTTEEIDFILDLNVKAAWMVAARCAEGLIAAGLPGSIINMSSQMGHRSWKERALYSASKHAVEGFTKGMAIEWAPHNIRVNTLCPTFIETDLTAAKLADPEFRDAVLAKIPLGRVGTVTDIMGPVLFLASDASALVTGSALFVDGGWTAA